jgi:hypothetical protein
VCRLELIYSRYELFKIKSAIPANFLHPFKDYHVVEFWTKVYVVPRGSLSIEYRVLLPLFGNKCQGIVLESMKNLDFRDTRGHLFPNKGSNFFFLSIWLYMVQSSM